MLLVAGMGSHVSAQAVTGVGADATPLPKGSVRIRVAGIWDGHNEVFGDDGRRPMFGTLATPSLGVRQIPQLTGVEQAIRALSSNATFGLSLGPLEARGDARQAITPMSFDVGLTSRLSIGLVVPYVESRDNAFLILNRNGTGATVGQNPAYSSTAGAAARNVNGILLRQLAQSRAQLSAEIARCATASETACDAVRANPSGAQQLLLQSLATQTAIATVYGDSTRAGAPVVPISGSAIQASINANIAALRSSFAGFGVTNLADGILPAPATIVNGPAAITRILADSAFGLDYARLGGTRRAGIGDVDLTATFLWFNTLGARPAQWLAAKGFGIRSQVTGGWRFGSAGADRTNDAFDVPIGDGANALLARTTTDVVFNRRAWISGTLRVAQPLGDEVMMRRPLLVDSLLFVPSVVGAASRTLGRRIDLELAPRLVLGQFFGISGGYLMRRAGADRYAFHATDSLTASTVTTAARTYQAVMAGVTFSTMSSYVRGRSKWPVEVLYSHAVPISGSGDAPAVSTDRLELRIYTGFPRR
jgi:hypothetical protein